MTFNFSQLISYSNLPLFFTLIIGVVFGVLIILATKEQRRIAEREKLFIQKVEQITRQTKFDQLNEKDNSKMKVGFSWNKYWGRLFKYPDLIDSKTPDSAIGSAILLTVVLIYGGMTIYFRNIGVGFVPVFTILAILVYYCETKIKAKNNIFDEQIPAFLSSLKSNIQANETPERALINAIDNTNSPLFEELAIAKALTETSTFQVALTTLRNQTSNETIKFLCSCIELAASVGTNLEDQIDTIEDMLETRMRLKRKLDLAVNENKPTAFAASLILPFIFMYMFITSEQAREFWFVQPISWLIFFLAIGIFIGGLFLVSRVVKKTSKF